MASLFEVFPLCLILLLIASAQGQLDDHYPVLRSKCHSNYTSEFATCDASLQNSLSDDAQTRLPGTSDADVVCSLKDEFIAYTACYAGVFQRCLPSEYRGLVQTEERARQAYNFFCTWQCSMNSHCTSERGKDCVTVAVANYTASRSQPDLVSRTCSLMDTLGDCYRDGGRTCSCHSTYFFGEYFRRSNPPTCGAEGLSVATPILAVGALVALVNKMAAFF